MTTARLVVLIFGVCVGISAGAAAGQSEIGVSADPYPSTYRPLPSASFAITHLTVLTGAGTRMDDATVLIEHGNIAAVGNKGILPDGLRVIDGTGKWLTPGLIDVHSHMGAEAQPSAFAHEDINEMTDPNTSGVWVEHSVWPQDPAFARALAGGVTTMQILPGSANLFGGRSVILKNVPATTVQAMKFPGAPYGLKMACGENPKRWYGVEQKKAPLTRMGSFLGYRTAFIKAQAYQRKWDKYRKELAAGKSPDPPDRDLGLETLAGVLRGEILVHMHCYEADEMAQVIDLSREFGFHVSAFHHAPEAYKIASLLADNHICAAIWADWWGFKLEAYDGIRENLAMVERAGACAIVHSDSAIGVQHLNLAVAQALADGRRAGIDIAPEKAMRWITLNAAKSLGIQDRTGSIEVGKAADVVLWGGDPFSVYTHAEQVYIDGALVYDRADPAHQPLSDFEIGQKAERALP
jgi:imidazolonepropionase-like amidohydrolase